METSWLTEDEQRAWTGFLRLQADLMAFLNRQLMTDSGLTAAEFGVLAVVSQAPDQRIRSRDLGRTLGWERSRLSHQLSRMVKRGTVARAECDDDARGFDVVLTAEGRAVIEAAAPPHVESVRRNFIDLLSAEQLAALAEIADIITTHLSAECDADCGEADCDE